MIGEEEDEIPYIGLDVAHRIATEVILGKKPSRTDSPDEARFRAATVKDVAEIIADGHIPELPGAED